MTKRRCHDLPYTSLRETWSHFEIISLTFFPPNFRSIRKYKLCSCLKFLLCIFHFSCYHSTYPSKFWLFVLTTPLTDQSSLWTESFFENGSHTTDSSWRDRSVSLRLYDQLQILQSNDHARSELTTTTPTQNARRY